MSLFSDFFKNKILLISNSLKSFTSEDEDIIIFINDIWKWDNEIETVITCYYELTYDDSLAYNPARFVIIDPSKAIISKLTSDLINEWNRTIKIAQGKYNGLSEYSKREISVIEIDFNLYNKMLKMV
jgi:hypothetical protein